MNKTIYIISVLIALVLAGCSSREKESLALESDSAIISPGENAVIPIKHGNGDYTVGCYDESVVLAGFSRTGKHPGNLLLTGISDGETWVTVTDNIGGGEVRVKVVVEDSTPLQEPDI